MEQKLTKTNLKQTNERTHENNNQKKKKTQTT